MLDIKMQLSTTPKEKPDQTKLGFGIYYTDNMFVMEYTKARVGTMLVSFLMLQFLLTLQLWFSTTLRNLLKA